MGLGVPEMMAIGGVTGLLTGGLKGGLKGAALGGIGGGIGNALKGSMIPGAVVNGIGTNALAGGDVAKGLAINGSLLGGANAFETSMGLAGLPGAGTIESAGMVFNPTTGTYLNPEYYAGASTPFATYKGGEGLLSNLGGGLLNKLPDYVTPQNVMGAANILSGIQTPQRQMPSMGGGGVKQGQTQGLNVAMGGAQLIKRRGQA